MNKDDGLSSSNVLSVLQDYKGFMWIGTVDGLNRYDGTKFIIYNNITSDSTGLDGYYVRAILEDHNKNLFFGTDRGLSLYNRDLDLFLNYRYDKSSSLYNMAFNVFKIIEDTIGNLWIATDNGLIYFDRKNNKIVQYRHDPVDPFSISDNNLESIFIDKSGRFWISTWKGLNFLNRKTGKFEHIIHCKTDNENIAATFFLGITEDRNGNIWFGSTDGLFCLENGPQNTKLELIHYKNNPSDPKSISSNRVKSLFVDDEGSLWIGTENAGINLFEKDKKKFAQYRIDEYNPMSLNNESIQDFTRDRSGNLWVCTFGGGLNIATKNSDVIVHYKNMPGAPLSLSYNIVSCFYEGRNNQIWVGTDGGGLNLLDKKTDRFIRYNSKNSGLSSNSILCMTEGDENQIWMGTWAGGIVSYNYSDNKFKPLTTQNSGIPDNNIHAIAKDEEGNLWLGSFGHGLIHYIIKENKFVSYVPENSQIGNKRITVIRINKNGQLFLGITSGLQVFNPKTSHCVSYTDSLPGDEKYLSNKSIYDILIFNDTCVWLATHKGLDLFNPIKGTFKKFFKKNGLPDDALTGLAIDKAGILWITTNAGISRFDFKNNSFKNFTKVDGIQGNEFCERSIYTANNGDIAAGGKNGFNIISPEKISENKNIPEVVITDFYIFNKEVKIGISDSPLKEQISEAKKIVLSYKQSVLTFYFAIMDYTNPGKNQYAYMMENFDKDWIYSGNRKEATYTNLNPGKYIFHVKGSNNDGIWNETGTNLEIIIKPPWWKTKVALTGFTLLIICLFLGFYFFRINQLQKQKELLEKLVKERTREIEEKNKILYKQTNELNETNVLLEERQQQIEEQAEELLTSNAQLFSLNATKDKFFSIIAHDLKNPFTSILGFCEILSIRYEKMDDVKRKHLVRVVYESSKNLYKLLENLLQWARSQTGNIKYEPEEFVLNEVIDANISLVENLVLEKKLEIIKNPDSKIKIFADKNMINTVIRNLITNAIKFTENGTISILVDQDDEKSKVSIVDTGVGIKEDKLDKIFDVISSKSTYGTKGESGTGLGLIICKEFIEKHHGTISVLSEPGKGSNFYFTIPNKVI